MNRYIELDKCENGVELSIGLNFTVVLTELKMRFSYANKYIFELYGGTLTNPENGKEFESFRVCITQKEAEYIADEFIRLTA